MIRQVSTVMFALVFSCSAYTSSIDRATSYNISVGSVEHSAHAPSFTATVRHEHALVSSSFYCHAELLVRQDAEPVPEPFSLSMLALAALLLPRLRRSLTLPAQHT